MAPSQSRFWLAKNCQDKNYQLQVQLRSVSFSNEYSLQVRDRLRKAFAELSYSIFEPHTGFEHVSSIFTSHLREKHIQVFQSIISVQVLEFPSEDNYSTEEPDDATNLAIFLARRALNSSGVGDSSG
jgi:hypothetical protein